MEEHSLPAISKDQNNAIQSLKNNNVLIDSVAGCGKTTTNLYIGKILHDKSILLLTYNAKLKTETREKVAFHDIDNIEENNIF